MANELNFYGDPATDSGLTIVARIYDSAGAQVGSDVSCSEVGSLAIYVGSMPSASSGQYGVRFFAGSETTPRATGLIDWNGSSEVTLAALESALPAAIYAEFISGSNEDAFKAEISGVPTVEFNS